MDSTLVLVLELVLDEDVVLALEEIWTSPRPWPWPWSWPWSWARMWSAPRDTWTGGTTRGGHSEESLVPWPDRDLEGADSDSRTKAEGPNIKAGTKHRLGGPTCVTKHIMGLSSCWNEHQGQLCRRDTRGKTTGNSSTGILWSIMSNNIMGSCNNPEHTHI